MVWKKNGIEIKDIPGKIQINIIGLQQSITIQDANDDDAGVYTCECENIKTQTNVKVIGMYMIFLFFFFFYFNVFGKFRAGMNSPMYVFNRNCKRLVSETFTGPACETQGHCYIQGRAFQRHT